MEDLVEALSIATLSKSEVSRMCTALDTEVAAFRGRSLAGERYPSYPPRDRGPQDRRTIGGIRIETPFRSVAEVGHFIGCALLRRRPPRVD